MCVRGGLVGQPGLPNAGGEYSTRDRTMNSKTRTKAQEGLRAMRCQDRIEARRIEEAKARVQIEEIEVREEVQRAIEIGLKTAPRAGLRGPQQVAFLTGRVMQALDAYRDGWVVEADCEDDDDGD